ncbi:MAG: Fur family transcriptional regulator [Syntrophobacteraceae bacterium]
MKEMSDKDYIEALRSHGLQVTYQRLAIYKALDDSVEHPSAETVYQKVKKQFPMISLGTVYKTLEKFQEKGLIQRFGPLTDVARYETLIDNHHHLVCVKCQTIKDIPASSKETGVSLPQDHGFRVLGQQVIIRGYCPNCAKE